MSAELGIAKAVCDWLAAREVPALEGWSGKDRPEEKSCAVVVSVREYDAHTAAFAHYLGERYNVDTAAWEEVFGRKVELKLGLDLYAPEEGTERELQQLLERLTALLTLEAPEGIRIGAVTCGQTRWDEQQRRLRREVTAACTVWLQAVGTECAEFLNFELRGGWKH